MNLALNFNLATYYKLHDLQFPKPLEFQFPNLYNVKEYLPGRSVEGIE